MAFEPPWARTSSVTPRFKSSVSSVCSVCVAWSTLLGGSVMTRATAARCWAGDERSDLAPLDLAPLDLAPLDLALFATGAYGKPLGAGTHWWGFDWSGLARSGPSGHVAGTVVGALGSVIQRASLNTAIAVAPGCATPFLVKYAVRYWRYERFLSSKPPPAPNALTRYEAMAMVSIGVQGDGRYGAVFSPISFPSAQNWIGTIASSFPSVE
jgi:hypothetical protein